MGRINAHHWSVPRGYLAALVDPPPFATEPGPQPQATPLARLQGRQGNVVTNRRHRSVQLDDVSRALLCRLDGTHDRGELTNWLAGAIARGEFQVHRDDRPLSEVDDDTLRETLDATLRALADSALIIA